MIKLVLSDKEIRQVRAFCSKGYFGARINTTLAAYGTDDRFVRTWYEEKDGHPVAVVQLTEGAAVVQCAAGADFESLAALLQFSGAQTVIGEHECVNNLPFSIQEKGCLMHLQGSVNASQAAEYADSEKLPLLYPVLFGENTKQEQPMAYAAWFSDLSHRVRHGLCACFAVYEDQKAVSCAAVLYSNAQYGCIGAVATLPCHRGHGLGKACTLAAAQAVLESGQIPCLACTDNGIHAWYEQMGFAVYGAWTEMKI